MKKTTPTETREQLLEKRSELLGRLETIRRDASRLDRNEDEQSLQSVLNEFGREAVEELRDIQQKLRRLENPGPS